MPFTLRQFTGGKVAFAVWLLPSGSTTVVKITQAEYDEFAVTRKGVGDPAGRPHPTAVFLMAAGGIPALDTIDGHAHAGDAYERQEPGVGTVLVVAHSDEPEWSYSFASASDPGTGRTSRLLGKRYQSSGHATVLKTYDLATLPTLVVPSQPRVSVTDIDEIIPNHRSVTFDAQSSGSVNSATSLTVSHTMSASANGYLAAVSGCSNALLTSVTYAGDSLTSRITQAFATYCDFMDRVSPATGTNNIVFTNPGSGVIVGGGLSATGVHQTTPRTSTGNTSGTSTSPSLTLSSATGELVFVAMVCRWQPTVTPDGTWTIDFNLINGANDIRVVAGHKSGAASVTRTDSFDASQNWDILGASIAAAAEETGHPAARRFGMFSYIRQFFRRGGAFRTALPIAA